MDTNKWRNFEKDLNSFRMELWIIPPSFTRVLKKDIKLLNKIYLSQIKLF